MLQFPQFVWALRSSVWEVFNNFLLIEATERSKISSYQKRFFIALSLYPLSYFVYTPFKRLNKNVKNILYSLKFYTKLIFNSDRWYGFENEAKPIVKINFWILQFWNIFYFKIYVDVSQKISNFSYIKKFESITTF